IFYHYFCPCGNFYWWNNKITHLRRNRKGVAFFYANFSRSVVKENIHLAEFTIDKKHEIAEGLQVMSQHWKKINPAFRMATCAEDIDLTQYEIEHNKCIDDELMIRVFREDTKLMSFIGYKQGLFGEDTRTETQRRQLKDRNQRKWCGCVYSKDVGCYTTCAHYCTYCYANTSHEQVRSNMQKTNPDSDSILTIKK
ncbi:DUF1848 family protein, partial [Massilibacteroides sp.]|uniref:DUF1848 family protein n=1 Tax=Massilibacteroides sp. TaxID=2034766 RepID=UPI00263396DC